MRFDRRRNVLRLLAVFGLGACLQHAIGANGGETILVLVDKAGAGGSRKLDLAALARLPQHSFTTNTPWAKQPQKFTGPLLRDVLALANDKGKLVKAMALNDYQITIPVQDARDFDMIVAHQIDGKPIPVRERGPLFVIYPFDQKPELRAARYYDRSIWQLKSLVIE